MRDLERLRLLPLEVLAEPLEEIELPAFAGSTLRGAFGHALLDTVCVVAHRDCGICPLVGECAYPYLFETRIPAGARRLVKQPFAPHPYVLRPPPEAGKGSPLRFGMTLIGRAVERLPLVAEAICRMGGRGLARERGRFRVDSIHSRLPGRAAPTVLVEGDPPILLPEPERAVGRLGDFLVEPDGDRIAVRIRAPLRIVRRGVLEEQLPFHVLVRALLRRASSLLEFHEGIDLDVDFKGLIARAEQVLTRDSSLRRENRVRYSVRQERRMNLAGISGTVVYQGDLEPFLPLLALGQAVGVGKGTTFGLGLLEVTSATPDALHPSVPPDPIGT